MEMNLAFLSFIFAQNPKQYGTTIIFEASSFAVDPGDGSHISYKINHGTRRANLTPRAMKTSTGQKTVVFCAVRVRSSLLLACCLCCLHCLFYGAYVHLNRAALNRSGHRARRGVAV